MHGVVKMSLFELDSQLAKLEKKPVDMQKVKTGASFLPPLPGAGPNMQDPFDWARAANKSFSDPEIPTPPPESRCQKAP